MVKMVKLNKFHRKNIERMLKKVNCPIDIIDINAIWDSSLSAEENFNRIKEELKKLGYVNVEDYYQKDEKEYLEHKMTLEEEKHYRKEFEKRIKEIKRSANLDVLDFYPKNFKPLVDMIIKGYIKTLFIVGDTGVGKTYLLNALLPPNTIRIGGHITPYKLYSLLYQYREKTILFFDDTEDMLKSEIVLSILKQALDTTEPRKVCWISSRNEKIDLPKEFIFNSRVIFVCNKIPSGLDALISRSHKVEIELSYAEILQIMYVIAKKPIKINGKLITPEERTKIVDFIKENSDETTENFNLRTQRKIEEYYAYDKQNWKTYAKFLLSKKDDLLVIVKELIKSGKSVKEQIKEFNRLCNKSRATYYRLRKKLEKMSHVSSHLEYK